MLHLLKVLLLAVFSAVSLVRVLAQASPKYIVSGGTWRDTSGNIVDAHGGGIVQSNGTFYWIGGANGCCGGTRLYSSTDLVTWTSHGIVYNHGVSRPKLLYSNTTQTWQIWAQSNRQMNIATSSSILGPYTTVGTPFSPFGVNFTDFGLFLDTDGQAYALYSADHNNLVLSLISADHQNLTSVMHQFSGSGLESPAMFKEGDTYYVIGSHKTGYLVNNNVVYSAQRLTGPWSVQSYIAPMGSRTWNSQSTFVLTVQGAKGHVNMYMGDRWVPAAIDNSTYVWLPLTADSVTKGVQAQWLDAWSLDVAMGLITTPAGTKYEAEAGKIQGTSAYVATCPTCSGNKIVTSISSTSTLTIANVTGTGSPRWVSFHYIDTDGLYGDNTVTDAETSAITKQRNATVSLNGGPAVALPQYDTNAGIVMSVPLQLNLTAGSANTITIGAVANQSAGDLDYIVVY